MANKRTVSISTTLVIMFNKHTELKGGYLEIPQIHELLEIGQYTVSVIDNYFSSDYKPVVVVEQDDT